MRSDSIRLRLAQSEVEDLARGGVVAETVHFGVEPEQRLTYRVLGREAKDLGLAYRPGLIQVYLPVNDIRLWADSDQVGFSEELEVGGAFRITVTVEKDFRCLTERPGEDNADAYPHPEESKGHVGR